MKLPVLIAGLCGVAVSAFTAPAYAAEGADGERITAWEASRAHDEDDGKIVTGVARARDQLDSATSTNSLSEKEIVKIAPTSIADLFRNIPGIRAEASAGATNNSYTIRGLPLVSSGASISSSRRMACRPSNSETFSPSPPTCSSGQT